MREYEPVRVTRYRWYRGVGTLDPLFDGPLPQAQLDARFHGHSTKGNLYPYIHKYSAGLLIFFLPDFLSFVQKHNGN